jgi:threonine/homoserine/homoserine lactone efflux protein
VELSVFLRGLAIGFGIAAPVGPIGILCIRRTLADGRAVGFAAGLGAATADALYGAVAAFGLTLVSRALVGQRAWLQAAGGIFLCYLGIRTWMAAPAATPEASRHAPGLVSAWASTFALTLTNPTTILSFVAIFAGLGLGAGAGGYRPAALMVLGVFLGSALWWLLLSAGVGFFRSALTRQGLRWVNRLAAVIIAAFGIGALVGLLV